MGPEPAAVQAHSKGRRWAAADKARASFYGGGNDVSGSEAVTVLPGGGCNSTPVGFEPTRGDPIGLAGRRLNRSVKVSLMLEAVWSVQADGRLFRHIHWFMYPSRRD